MKKGSSPTKRLMQMKNAEWGHDKAAKDAKEKGDYSLKYTTSPKKSYVMEPKDGKIDYSKINKKDFKETLSNQ
jgi:hypothetical protein